MAARRSDPELLMPALAHEVGNLLAAIRLSAHLLAETSDAAERERGSREIERLAAEAGELLAHVRPLLTDAKARRSRVRVCDVLDGLARAWGEPEREGGALRVARAPADVPDLRVDPMALHYVLLVLVRTILKVGGAGPTVRVAASSEGARVVFDVVGGRAGDDPCALARRDLALRLTDAVMRRDRGRVAVAAGPRRTVVRVSVPAARRSDRPGPPRPRRGARPGARGGRSRPPAARGGPRPGRRPRGRAARTR